MARLGILYPATGAQGAGPGAAADYDLLQRRTGVPVSVALTPVGEDAHRVGPLRELNEPDRLLPAARRLPDVDALVWACTSASFVLGWRGARRQAAELGAALGVPASSTALAFVAALDHLGMARVSLVATYPPQVTAHLLDFLGAAGVEVVAHDSAGIPTAEAASRLRPREVVELARRGDHPAASAVVVPDTALPTAGVLAELDAALDRPVLTANQVTFWHALELAQGAPPAAVPGLGALSGR